MGAARAAGQPVAENRPPFGFRFAGEGEEVLLTVGESHAGPFLLRGVTMLLPPGTVPRLADSSLRQKRLSLTSAQVLANELELRRFARSTLSSSVVEVDLRLRRDYVLLVGRLSDPEGAADFTARMLIEAVGADEILLAVPEARVYRPCGTPGAIVAIRLFRRLRSLVAPDGQLSRLRQHGGTLRARPLDLLTAILPPAGFRLPSRAQVAISSAVVEPAGLALRYDRTSFVAPIAAPGRTNTFARVEEALSEDKLAEAIELLLRSQRDWEDSPGSWPQVLDYLSTSTETHAQALALAARAADHPPTRAAALLCLGRIAEAQRDWQEAAAHYESAASASEDPEEKSRSMIAWSRTLAKTSASAAVDVLEKGVAELEDPGALLDALAELEGTRARPSGVVGALRRRVAVATPLEEARVRTTLARALRSIGEETAAQDELLRALEAEAISEETLQTVSELASAPEFMARVAPILESRAEHAHERQQPGIEWRLCFYLGRLLERAGQAETARRHFQRALSLAPRDPAVYEHAARAELAAGDPERAFSHWQSALELRAPQDRVPSLRAMAQAAVASGNTDRAREAIQAALQLDFGTETIEAAGAVAHAMGDAAWEAELLAELERRIDGPQRAICRVALARILGERLAQPDRGIEMLEEVLSSPSAAAPTRADAFTAMADLYAGLGQADAERRTLERLISESPAPKASLRLGRMLASLGEVARARRHLEVAAEAGIEGALPILREVLTALGDTRALERWLMQIAERGTITERAEAQRELGRIRLDRGDAEGARRAFSSALESEDRDAISLRGLAEAARRLDHWQVAAESLERLIAVTSPEERIETFVSWGEALERLGEAERASAAYQSAIDLGARGAPARQALTRMYAIALDQNDPERAAGVASAAAMYEDVEISTRDRASWFVRAAELWRRNFKRDDQAEAALQLALSTEPAYVPALDALESVYRDRGAWSELADVLHRKAGALVWPDESEPVLERLAEVQAGPLGLAAAAADTYLRLLEVNTRHPTALLFLARHAQARGRDDEAEAYDNEIIEIPLPMDALREVRLRRTRRAMQRGRDSEAEAELRAALALLPNDPELLEALQWVLERRPPSEELVRLLETRLESAEAPQARAQILRRLGDCLRPLDRSREALDSYRRALTEDSSDVPTLVALAELLRKLRHWDELFPVLESLAKHAIKADERAAAWRELAQLYMRQSKNTEQAAHALEQADQANPHDPELRLLQAELAVRRGSLQVVDRLTAELEQQGTPLLAIESLRMLMGQCSNHQASRGRLVLRLAELESRLGRDEAAKAHFQQAVVDLEAAGTGIPLEERTRALLRVADVELLAGALDKARDLYELILAREPDSREALGGLEAAARRAGDMEALFSVLRRRADSADKSSRGYFLREAAEISAERLHRYDAAIELWEAALELVPDDPSVRRALRNARRQAGDPKNLAKHLEKDLSSADDDTRIEILRELSGLYAGPLHDSAKALKSLRRLVEVLEPQLEASLKADPQGVRLTILADALCGLGRRDEAFAWLERAIAQGIRGRVTERLADLYRAEKRHEELGRLLTTWAKDATGEEAARLWEQAAKLFHELGDTKRAAELYGNALRAAPGAVPHAGERARALLLGNHEEVLALLDLEIGAAPPERLMALRGERGLVLLELKRAEEARADLESAALDDPGWYEVRAALGALLHDMGRPEIALPHLLAAADGLKDHAKAVEAGLRAAALLEAEDRRTEAEARYEKACVRSPEDERPLRALVRLGGPPPVRAERLVRLSRLVQEPERLLLQGQAALAWRAAGREVEAYAAARMAAQHPEAPREVLEALAALASARSEWTVAVEALRRRLSADPEEHRPKIHLEIATILSERLFDPSRALPHFEEAAKGTESGVRGSALAALDRIYTALGQPVEAARAAAERLSLAEGNLDRAERAYHAAERHERAGSVTQARELYVIAAELSGPDAEAAALRFARLAADEPSRRRALALLLRQAGLTTTLPTRADLWRRVLTLAEALQERKAIDQAVRALLEDHADDVDALVPVREALERHRDGPGLIRLLGAQIAKLSGKEAAALAFEFGRILEQIDDLPRSRVAYERALAADPDDPALVEVLADICWRTRSYDRARILYERLAERGSSLPRDEISFRRGVLAEVSEAPTEAESHFRAALALNPHHKEAQEALARLVSTSGATADPIQRLHRLLQLVPPEDAVRTQELHMELAQAHLGEKSHDQARKYLEQILAYDPAHLPAVDLLSQLLERMGEIRGAAELYERAAALHLSSGERVARLDRAGELRYQLGEPKLALDLWLRGLDIDPTHVQTLEHVINQFWAQGDFAHVRDLQDELSRAIQIHGAAVSHTLRARVEMARTVAGEISKVETEATLASHLLVEVAAALRSQQAPLDALDPILDATVDARTAFEALAEARSADPDARRLSGRIADRGGDLRRAWAHYGICSYLDPTDPARARYEAIASPGLPTPEALGRAAGPLPSVFTLLMPLLEGFLAPLDAYPRAQPFHAPWLDTLRKQIGGAHALVVQLPGGGCDVFVENTVPPRILVGAGVPGLDQAQQVFLFARAFHSLRQGGPLLRKLDVVEIEQLFRALAGLLDGQTPTSTRVARSLAALPFRPDLLDFSQRRQVVKELLGLVHLGVERVVTDAQHAPNRVALLLCRDMRAALRALGRVEAWAREALDAEAKRDLLEKNPAMMELARFATEEAPDLWGP